MNLCISYDECFDKVNYLLFSGKLTNRIRKAVEIEWKNKCNSLGYTGFYIPTFIALMYLPDQIENYLQKRKLEINEEVKMLELELKEICKAIDNYQPPWKRKN